MHKILAALHLDDPASLKRALTTALSATALLSINPILLKVGVQPISDATIASVAGLVTVFVLQSGLKSRAIAMAGLAGRSKATQHGSSTIHHTAKR